MSSENDRCSKRLNSSRGFPRVQTPSKPSGARILLINHSPAPFKLFSVAVSSLRVSDLASPAAPQTFKMNLSGNQDWDTVVISKKRPNAASAQKPSNVNAAIRAGAQVDTVKKQTAGNTAARGPIKSAVKLENDTETFEHERVSSELKKQIQSARLAKKLTQAQLAQMINEKPQTINEYEAGKAIPNPQILGKMSRVLGVTLKKNPGKK